MAICSSAWSARQIQRLSLEAWPSETTEKLAFFKHRFKIAIIFQSTLITTTPNVLLKNLKHDIKFLFVSDQQSLWSADGRFHFLTTLNFISYPGQVSCFVKLKAILRLRNQ